MKKWSVAARTLFLLVVATALSVVLRVLLPDEIGVAATTVLGLAFMGYLIAMAVLHRRKAAPPPRE
jgi:uncharacterized membrane protein